MKQSSEALWEYFNSVHQMFRGEKACPWLKTQTHESLLPYLKEEVGEFMEALQLKKQGLGDQAAINELGDLWLQSVLHLILLSETSGKSVAEALDSWTAKVKHRHPHVFDPIHSQKTWTLQEVLDEWKKRKKIEKDLERAKNPHAKASKTQDFREYASSLSELVRAHKIGERSSQHNFDWQNPGEVLTKIEEEIQELKAEMKNPHSSKAAHQDELGDLLFSTVQLARHLGISSEEALAGASDKFIRRFEAVEGLAHKKDPVRASGDWKEIPRDELENLWIEAKKELRSQGKTKT